ncbi:hypothetical protein BGZ99_008577 [Dissophora globulifera]|uniref:Uncharacterized protein n=1 Tax=Dissophora globulifera TaxID=979702 RepID=A0A9P6UPE5_9FUNG|nr:hypothetical protein BGZ99_008577 [Dissophora globulifera]
MSTMMQFKLPADFYSAAASLLQTPPSRSSLLFPPVDSAAAPQHIDDDHALESVLDISTRVAVDVMDDSIDIAAHDPSAVAVAAHVPILDNDAGNHNNSNSNNNNDSSDTRNTETNTIDDTEDYQDDDGALLALLGPDKDVVPSMPVIEVLFEDSLHELFYASSDAFKASRLEPVARGALLLDSNDSLLDEPLSVLFQHLRQELLAARYGTDEAAHYEMGMIFKSLDDLWLLEHEGAASCCSLSKLIDLYMTNSGLQDQEMLLEPFRFELTVQETFMSHLGRLEGQKGSKVQLAQSDTTASDAADVNPLLEQTGIYLSDLDMVGFPCSAARYRIMLLTSSWLFDVDDETLESVADVLLNEDQQHDKQIGVDGTDSERPVVADSDAGLHEDEAFDVSKIDVDSLACFDDKAYEQEDDYGELDTADEHNSDSQDEFADHTANSPTSRSPKRSVEELMDLLDDDFVNRLSPDQGSDERLKRRVLNIGIAGFKHK